MAAVLDVEVVPLDVAGAPQRTPDCLVVHRDGREGPLEIMRLTTTASEYLQHRLAAISNRLPAVGHRVWFAQVSTVAELDHLIANYAHLIQQLEQYDAHQIEGIPPWVVNRDLELHWLATSGASLTRDVLAEPSATQQPVLVLATGFGAVWDPEADVISPAVQEALTTPTVVEHIEKLVAYPGSERHLFLIVDPAGIAPEAAHVLTGVDQVPAGVLDLPAGLSRLWVVPIFGERLLLWTAGEGWSLHQRETV